MFKQLSADDPININFIAGVVDLADKPKNAGDTDLAKSPIL